MSLAKELVPTQDPLPLQLLIESANVDSPGKIDGYTVGKCHIKTKVSL
jgi:hypothetical protein